MTFVLDGHRRYSRWRQGAEANDTVVVHGSGTWAFSSLSALRSAWPCWRPSACDAEPPVVDFDTVRSWLGSPVLTVPHGAVLDAWNFAGDVPRGVGTSWADRGWRRDGVYAKLWAASVAAPLGHPEWTPQWSPLEHRVLLDMAHSGVRTVRAALDRQPE